MTVIARTARLVLRTFVPASDTDAAYELYGDPEAMRWVAGGPLPTRAATATVLEAYAEAQERDGFSCWAVEERATGRLLGDCGLTPLGGSGPEVELGFTLRPDAQGRGYGREAAEAALAVAFGPGPQLTEVVAVARPENRASLRLLGRLGFTATGPRDAYGETLTGFRLPASAWAVRDGGG